METAHPCPKRCSAVVSQENLTKHPRLVSQETLTKKPFRRNNLSLVGADMKKAASALTIILALLASVMAGVSFIKVARANFIPAADISITSPANETYNSNLLVLNYTVYFTLTKNQLVAYSIDGGANVTIFSKYKYSSQFYETICKQVMLPELSDGSHHLEVYAVYAEGEGASDHDQVYFTVDTTPPVISNLSVENKTYYSTDIPLNFTVNEAVSQISYSIDNQANLTINGDTTLAGLVEGSHSLVVYANDTAGNIGASETVNFTVATVESQSGPELFPVTFIAAASGAFVIVVGAGLLVYFNKRKRRGELP
jgi:hypothetical protein